jgi:glycosyltransferase involved in cell wall biosynthesis
MHVAHISSDYPYTSLYRRFLLASAALGRDEHSMYVPLQRGRPWTREQDVDAPGLAVHYSEDFSAWQRLAQGSKRRAVVSGFRRAFADRPWDVLHAHYLFSSGGPAQLLAREARRPFVVAVRNADRNTFLRLARHLRPLGRAILQDAARVIFLSPGQRDAVLADLFPNGERAAILGRTAVIPNGISTWWHGNRRLDVPLRPEGRLRMVFVGDFNENKNIRSIVRVARRLRRDGLDPHLTLVGDGPLLPWAAAEAARWPSLMTVHPRIRDEAALASVIREHDVFVMPSIHETFGMVYIEALSQGVPIVWTRGQGIDGWFPPGSVGWPCDPRDDADIARALTKVATHHAEMAWHAARAIEAFSWPRIAVEYADLYRSVGTLGGPEAG